MNFRFDANLTALGYKVKPLFGDTRILHIVISSLAGVTEGTIFSIHVFYGQTK